MTNVATPGGFFNERFLTLIVVIVNLCLLALFDVEPFTSPSRRSKNIMCVVLLDLPNTTAIWSSVMVSLASMAFTAANSCRLREFIGSF